MESGRNDGWAAIYTGPAWTGYAVESLLREAGIPTFMPDANNRLLHPDLFGGSAFTALVCVPATMADTARNIIASSPYATA